MGDTVRVLIVDDEEEFAFSLSKVLVRRGFSVQAAPSGKDALDRLKDGKFDVVLLDVKMPGENGIELIPAIKAVDPEVRVILMTGHISPQEESTGKGSGAFAYLLQPYPIEDLTELILRAARTQLYPKGGGPQ